MEPGPRGSHPAPVFVKAGGGYSKPATPYKSVPNRPAGFGGRGPHQRSSSAHASPARHVAVAKPLPLSREELERRRHNNLCLHCGKPGHQARECPVKKSLGERKGSSQRNLHAKGSKGSKGGKGGKAGKSKGLSHGRKGVPGRIRELDAHGYPDDDYEACEDYEDYPDDYDDYYPEDEESVTPPEGALAHPSVA